MARSFNPATPDYLQAEQALFTTTPLTVVAWFKKTDIASIWTDRVIWWQGVKATANHNLKLVRRGNLAPWPQKPRSLYWASRDTASKVSSTLVAALPKVWHCGAGIEVSTAERQVFLNGKQTIGLGNADAFAVAHDRVTIGRTGQTPANSPWDGEIGRVVAYAAALSAHDVETLNTGIFDPRRFRPSDLVEIWPLNGTNPEIGIISGLHLTLYGSPGHVNAPPTSFFMAAA